MFFVFFVGFLASNLTEAEEIRKRWQEHTEELHKRGLNDSKIHNDVFTHLELDIMECEVKWALGSIAMNKASGGDGTPVELFQILKDDAVKVLHLICQQNWKTQQWPQSWKRSGQEYWSGVPLPSPSLSIREMQIKGTMRHHLIPVRMSNY